MFKRISKFLGFTILILLLVLGVSAYLLTQQKVQNRLAREATVWLGKKLDTKVNIENVRIDFLKYVHFEGLYIEDQQQDTLAYIHDFRVRSSSVFKDLWNDKTSIIKSVKLKGGVINLNRTKNSDVWNYAFVEKAFATESKEDSTKSNPINLELKNVDVKNVRFAMLDKWAGQDIVARAGDVSIRVNTVDIPNLIFNIKKIEIADTDFTFKEYKGGEPRGPKKAVDQSEWGTPFNPNNLRMALGQVKLDNVNFEYQLNGHISKKGRFDEKHIVANNLRLDIEELTVLGDTVQADILDMNVTERSGLKIKKLRSKVTLNQQLAELDNLYLETNHSVVRDYYSMRYTNFHDFNNYIEGVNMYARFKNSKIDKRDIAYFSGNVSELPAVSQLSGKAEGTVANLYVPKVSLRSPDLQYDGSARIIGLPDIDNTFFKLEADRLVTNGKEITRLAPAANTGDIKWDALNNINFKGTFNGTVKKFNADGFLATNQGDADVDLFMNFNTAEPSYRGLVDATNFNLGKILGQDDIGKISARAAIDGQGFDFDKLNAGIDATVSEIYFQGERYENISLKGNVKDKLFNGLAKSADPRMGFDFSGGVNLSGDQPSYDFKSDIVKVNLKTLGVTPNDVFLKAKVKLDFKGKNIDEFVGKAILQNVTVRYDTNVINIPQMRLNSFYTDKNKKILDLKSTVADARIEGQYTLTGIDKTIRSFLHYYIPTFIAQEGLPENEIYDFDVLVKNANKIIQIYEPKLRIDSGTTFKGNINTAAQNLNMTAVVPNVTYDGIRLGQLGIVSTGSREVFTSEIMANEVWANNTQIVTNAKLDFSMSSDTAHVKLITKPADDFLGEAILDFKAQAYADRVRIDLNPSSFIVKDDKYLLNSEYPIEYTTEGVLLSKDVFIENGTQQFIINTLLENGTNNAIVNTTNIDLEKVSNYLNLKDYVLHGRVNSDIKAVDLWGNTIVTGSLSSVDNFRLNNDTLGVADVQFVYNRNKNELEIKENSKLEQVNNFVRTAGTLNFDKNSINMNANIQNTPLSLANKFVEELVDSLKGTATGEVSITGPMKNPTIEGALDVKAAALKVIFTGCTYSFSNFNVKLNNNSITFDPISVFDERENPGRALLTGQILHKNYDKYRLQLNATSENLLGLNTDELEADLFYGFIPAKFDMSITGAFDDITMDIDAKPLEGAKFYMPLGSDGAVGTYDYIRHRDLGRYQDVENKSRKGASYFKMNMDIEATPDVLATIILDQNTREKIEARGTGNISLNVDLGNDIQMFNTFTVSEGVYLFNFRGLLPKEFQLEKGGTITWNGDAYEAVLDMQAIYKANLALYPLVSNQLSETEEIREAKREFETDVIIDLTGPLSTPKIVFDIEQKNNPQINSLGQIALERIRQDQNELIYQAGMILLFNSFKSVGGGVSAGNLASTTGISTASDMIGATLSPLLNDAFNKLTGIKNINLNLGYKNYSSDVTTNDALNRRNQFNFDVSGKFFKDRLIIDYGNSFDIGNNNTTVANNSTIVGDFRAQYLLTLDGRYRLNGFRVSTNDITSTGAPVNRGGVGLTYKKTFNSWKDLFSNPQTGKSITPLSQPIPKNKEPQSEENSTQKKAPSDSTVLSFLSRFSFSL